jgi:hypothetical protein
VNKLARILATLEAGPLTVREVTRALGLPADRKHTPPVGGAMTRLEILGLVERVPDESPIKWQRVDGTAYVLHKTPRRRPDYRIEELPPEFRSVGSGIVVALRVAQLFTSGTVPSYRALMDEFGMSRETAFRWLNGWKCVTGEAKVTMRPAKGRKKPIKPAPMLAARL